jgi:tight adherence protein B
VTGAVAAASLAVLAWLLLGLGYQRRCAAEILRRANPTRASDPVSDRESGKAARPRWAPMVRPLLAVVSLGLGTLVAGIPGAVAGCVGAFLIPEMLRRRTKARRDEEVDAQLADAVASVAAGLRAGMSLVQALEFAAGESDPPLAASLHDVVDRTGMGIPLGESMDRWAEAVGGPDARLVAGVLRLHHRTGGDLPQVLDQLVRTLRDRRSSTREVRSLTAQARLSGAILGLLPVGFFLFLSATSRQQIAEAIRSPAGSLAIAIGLVLQAVAFLWIRRLLRVEA